MNSSIPIYTVSLPDYTVEARRDYSDMGRTLDRAIEAAFPGKRFVLRGITSNDHPSLSLNDLVALILETGTDRYDSQREGVHYPEDCPDGIFACSCETSPKLTAAHYDGDRCPTGSVMAEIMGDFYGGAIYDRGYPIRLDILMIYDRDQMIGVDRDSDEECLYRFKDPDQKRKALLGVIKIL